MAENKTKATKTSVAGYLSKIKDPVRRKDCAALSKIMTKAAKAKPVMWGTGIVGFGNYHYKYDSGREGDMCLTGFASRNKDLTIYLMAARFPKREELLARLGKHKTSGGCLYIKTMSDIDPKVLEKLIAGAVAEKRKNH
jgi:hypothetical protein